MKKIKRLFGLLFLMMCLFLPNRLVQAASFDILSTNIDAQIQENGDVHFKQEYLYDVEDMNGAWIDLDTSGHPLKNLRIGSMSESGKIQYFEENASEQTGTYQTNKEGNIYRFKIFYPSENEQVTFVLDYRLQGIITNYQDIAEFNWRIVGQGIDEELDVEAQIKLPDSLQMDEPFKVWGHGSPLGNVQAVRTTNPPVIKVQVDNNPAKTFVEVHALFPKRLTATNPNQLAKKVYQDKVKEEEDRVKRDRIKWERQQALGKKGMISLTGLATGILLVTFVRHFVLVKKANPRPAHLPRHLFQPPAPLPPAVAALAYMNETTYSMPTDFSSTLLDLKRRGYIEIVEVKQAGEEDTVDLSITGKAIDDLADFEKDALALIYRDNGQPLRLSELGDLMEEDEDYQERQQELMDDFVDDLQDQVELVKPDESPYTAKGNWNFGLSMILTIFLFIGAILLGAILQVNSEPAWSFVISSGILAFILLIIFIFIFVTRPIRSYEVDKEYKAWRAFGQMLKDIGQMDLREIGSLALWEEYLIYAVAFGYGKKVIKAMAYTFTTDELAASNLPMSFYTSQGTSLSHFNDSVSESVTQSSFGSSAYSGSNSSGSGGGFSSGSSGGGGGGSGAGGF